MRASISRATIFLLIVSLCLTLMIAGQSGARASDLRGDAQKFIDEYTAQWLKLRYGYTQAGWNSTTRIGEGDQTNAKATNEALDSRETTFL